MSKPNDGGPIFPREETSILFEEGHGECAKKIASGIHLGLTKREWSAGMVDRETVSFAAQRFMKLHNVDSCSEAEARFFYADEMISESQKGEKP